MNAAAIRFWLRLAPAAPDKCWLWRGCVDSSGYGLVRIDGRLVKAHRYAYERARGAIPPGLVVRHRCDVRRCCNPDHLETGTQADNMRDRDERGRHVALRGEAHGRAKLTARQASEICAAKGEPQRVTAARFGVSIYCISDIQRGKTWRHLRAA